MAEIAQAQHQKGSRHKRKIHSLKVDLTPMVDLGFLLITFFVITTSLREPKAADLFMPKDDSVTTPIKKSAVLTITLLSQDKLSYYHGAGDTAAVYFSDFQGIRKVIQNKQKRVASILGDPKETILIIKADSAASYKNLVDILDEVMINGIEHYYISE